MMASLFSHSPSLSFASTLSPPLTLTPTLTPTSTHLLQAIMGMVSPDHEQMHFSPPVQLRSDTERSLISHLQNSGRMRDVTLPILIRLGAKAFCWVHPNEDINGDESGGVLTAYGAFLYTFSDGSDPVFFHLVNPEAVHNAAEAVQAKMKSEERKVKLQRANTLQRGMTEFEGSVKKEADKVYTTLASGTKYLSARAMIGGTRPSPRVAPAGGLLQAGEPKQDGGGCCVLM